MFEQELYERKSADVDTAEAELFHNYEIKNWEPSKRLYQILAFSALLNIAALAFIGSTNLLTRRGCDSPFVGRVCQVLDMAYIGTVLLGTERDYVDQVYDKIDLGDSDITFISRDGDNAPLVYPDGYFQIANPEQFAAAQSANDPLAGFQSGLAGPIPGFPYTPAPQNDLLNTAPITPKVNPNPIKGEIPDSPFSVGGGTTAGTARKPRRGGKITADNSNSEKPDDEVVAEAAPEPTPEITSDTVKNVEVNKKPLTDFADEVVGKWATNEIDLNQQFTVALDGTITKDGKLDPKKSKFDKSKEKGDPKMVEVARRALEALGQSGFLTYLQIIGIEKINVVISQDETQITAVITSTQKTPQRAATISSQASLSIMAGKGLAKNPSDERTLLDQAKASTDGNNFVLNFAIPKPIAQEMINRKLKEAQAKKAQQPQPNGGAIGHAAERSGKE